MICNAVNTLKERASEVMEIISQYLKTGYLTEISIGTTTLAGALIGIGTTMTGMGFTAFGIGAGTLAAIIHSGIGNVVAGSAFATAQSLGALGVFSALPIVGWSILGVLVLCFGGYCLYRYLS